MVPGTCFAAPVQVLCQGNGNVMLPYGSQQYLGLGLVVFVSLVFIELFGSPFMKNAEVILLLSPCHKCIQVMTGVCSKSVALRDSCCNAWQPNVLFQASSPMSGCWLLSAMKLMLANGQHPSMARCFRTCSWQCVMPGLNHYEWEEECGCCSSSFCPLTSRFSSTLVVLPGTWYLCIVLRSLPGGRSSRCPFKLRQTTMNALCCHAAGHH